LRAHSSKENGLKLRKIIPFVAIFAAIGAMSARASSPGTVIEFSSLDKSHDQHVHGTLYLPEGGSPPYPAIVMVHGTAGIDEVGAFYRDPVRNAGIAVFEVDFRTGIYHGPMDRPMIATFLPLAYAALKELRKLPNIDANRIGYMGFSMGGAIGLRAAMENNRKSWLGDDKGFAAFAEFYPVTKPFIPVLDKSGSALTGVPMIIFYGTNDCYGEGRSVPEFKRLLAEKYHFEVTTVEYHGAAHDFNRNVPPMDYRDPAAIDQKGHTEWNEDAANDSLTRVVDFLSKSLAAR
jgi:dienelactone hydrolase